MSTRATIKFTEGEDVFFAYRHSDGFPENILDDIKNTTKKDGVTQNWVCYSPYSLQKGMTINQKDCQIIKLLHVFTAMKAINILSTGIVKKKIGITAFFNMRHNGRQYDQRRIACCSLSNR